MLNLNENTNIQEAIKGNSAAFESLVRANMDWASRLAMKVVQDPSGAMDVVQESFLKAYQSLGSLKDSGKFQSWLGGIVRSTAIDWLRRNNREVHLEELQKLPSFNLTDPKTLRQDALDRMVDEETRQRIAGILDSLPESYRDVLILKYMTQMSYIEISEALGISIAAIESKLFRARMLLKDKLNNLKF